MQAGDALVRPCATTAPASKLLVTHAASQYANLPSTDSPPSQYDTAVGGTDFNWNSSPSTYWSARTNNSTNDERTLGYVPEVPWNDTCTNPLILTDIEQDATAVSWSGNAVTDVETLVNLIAQDAINIFQNYTEGGQPCDVAFLVDAVGGGRRSQQLLDEYYDHIGHNETVGTFAPSATPSPAGKPL